ncbi:MAG: bifunctional diguanylate cyclase/phosphodiesterase [Turicibacter sp.]|nr:bifunctional diguanylate cyclase/phosphodiesterase [Turicibacter sp.]
MGSETNFIYRAYKNLLPDFVGAYAEESEEHGSSMELLTRSIVQVFIHTLKLDLNLASGSIFLFDSIDYDQKLELAAFESEKFRKGEFSIMLVQIMDFLFHNPETHPKILACADIEHMGVEDTDLIPDQSLLVPIFYSNVIYGYALVFYHEKADIAEKNIQELYRIMQMAAIVRRITLDEERFIKYLTNDHQTELPNRTYLYEAIVNLLQMAEVYESKFALLAIRVNGLKHINNSLGIVTGDLLLKEVGILIKNAIAELRLNLEVVVGRLNGVDFGVILAFPDAEQKISKEDEYNTLKASCAAICQAIINKTNDYVEINNYNLYLSANIGASIFPFHGETAEEILRKADIAKSAAKEKGFNSYKIYEHAMDSGAENVLFLNNNLPIAISQNQFELFYQAQVDVKTGFIVGAEALIRWRHPERGLIFPDEFIPFADENSYSIQIDLLVLEMACEQIKKWHNQGYDFSLSVNISPDHLDNGLICDSLQKMISRKSVNPAHLKVELLESTLFNDFEFAIKVLTRIREFGIAVALDDFGAGYSSLEYVAKLPMDYLKIDRTFLMNLDKNPTNKIILETIRTLAKGMKVKTIVEGTETKDHFGFLKEIGFTLAQGYYINRPLAVPDFEKLLKENQTNPFK